MDNISIYLSTYNVGTNSPPQDLGALLDFPAQSRHRPLPDFYVLGFQEVKSQPQNVMLDAIFSDPWTTSVTKILSKLHYVRAKSIRLQGLLLLVFCLRKHLIHLRDVETQYTRTGFGGMWGNKGAVSVRFSIYGCSICVVNSHLAPHDHQLEERIADYNNIIKSNTFRTKETENILYHDYLFWLGDLNFRLSERAPESPELIQKWILETEKDDYTKLLQYDQLRNAMASGEAFSQMTENPPRFPPTYKYEVGSLEYDIKKRRPAWTDRILFKVIENSYENVTLKAEQLQYHSLPQYTISDHKPVISEFNIKVRQKEISIKRMGRGRTFFDTEISNEIPEETVVFSNYTERIVTFTPMVNICYIGDADYVAKYTLSSDITVYPNDWIGVYEADFDNLDDYITYEYVGKVASAIPSGSGNKSRTIVFSFPVGSGVRSPGLYRFLYFNQPETEVRSLLGISDPFEVRVRDDDGSVQSERKGRSVVPPSPASSSSAGDNQQPSSSGQGIDSLLKDFSNLHVPGLKFNMLNDLSID